MRIKDLVCKIERDEEVIILDDYDEELYSGAVARIPRSFRPYNIISICVDCGVLTIKIHQDEDYL